MAVLVEVEMEGTEMTAVVWVELVEWAGAMVVAHNAAESLRHCGCGRHRRQLLLAVPP